MRDQFGASMRFGRVVDDQAVRRREVDDLQRASTRAFAVPERAEARHLDLGKLAFSRPLTSWAQTASPR